MSPLAAARAQMEISLGFHIIFAALGIGLPLLMLIAEGLYLRTGQAHYLRLCRKWARATALLFAVGAVSGTALSFELGLLWPGFMAAAGSIIGPAFALEGYAFFIEAIFIGLYLYGWERLSPRAHFLSGVPVALSGLASGVLVVAANAWMQLPVGFAREGTHLTPLSATAVFRTPVWPAMAVHATMASYVAVGFAVAGVYAAGLLRERPRDDYHRSGLNIALLVGAISAFLQVLSGDISARVVRAYEPIKFATMEGTVRPHLPVVHVAFLTMVVCGFGLCGLALWSLVQLARRRADGDRWLLRAVVLASPVGMLAIEAGWIVTEVGRQPYVIDRELLVADAVTPVAQVGLSLLLFTLLYLALGAALVYLLRALGNAEDHGHAAI